MKYVKMLGLAAVVAAAVMAFVGPASAMAETGTTLCKTNETPCSAANQYTTGQVISGHLKTGTIAKLKAGVATVECNESAVSLEQTSSGGASSSVAGKILSLSFNNSGGACNCKVTVETLGSGNISHNAGTMNGEITGSGTKVKIECGTTTCIYAGAITKNLTALGGAAPEVIANEAELEKQTGSGALCAKVADWHAEYTVTSPTPIYVSNGA